MFRKGISGPDREPLGMEHPRAGAVVGAGPVIRAMAAYIGLVDTIDRAVFWDADRCRLSPGERILALALLVDLLTEREPLYRVQEAFALTDPALVLGQGITPTDLGDDALGRALDKLAQSRGCRGF